MYARQNAFALSGRSADVVPTKLRFRS